MTQPTPQAPTPQFGNDYLAGCHPALLERLAATNMAQTTGYGLDPWCERAREKIRAAASCPGADVHFLVGGTQTNAIVIAALLSPWQGVIAADTAHIATHETGAIEAGGHKVIALPGAHGKLAARQIHDYARYYRENPAQEWCSRAWSISRTPPSWAQPTRGPNCRRWRRRAANTACCFTWTARGWATRCIRKSAT